MKENENKYLESFVDKIMKEDFLEVPSFDFTANIMAQVTFLEEKKVLEYKPLLSKWSWGLIFGLVLLLFGFTYLNPVLEMKTTWLNFDNYSFSLVKFNPSKVTIYAVLVAVVMLLIQLTFLKKYFDTKIES